MELEIITEKYLTQDRKPRKRFVLIRWSRKPIHAKRIGVRGTLREIEELKADWENHWESLGK